MEGDNTFSIILGRSLVRGRPAEKGMYAQVELKECYEKMGGNYDGAVHRLAKEDRIRRFLGLFLKDGSFQSLEAAVGAKDWAAAFRAAHTLKGVAMNLDLDRLAKSASELTEVLRGGVPAADVEPLFAEVREDYQLTVDAISALG